MAQRVFESLTRVKTRRVLRAGMMLVVAGSLTACGTGNGFNLGLRNSERMPDLINGSQGVDGPDEFAILPNKPIEIPEDLAALPTPEPGAGNRVDPKPKEDAVAALGGNPARVRDSGGAPRGDGGLVTAASRFGVAPGIREDLAADDLEFRRANDGLLLERLFNVTVYYKAYRVQSLDKYAELERFRRAGVRTVAAPPNPLESR